jgi:S-adenosylmethionine:tRNA ribosyltransferase-isomerase
MLQQLEESGVRMEHLTLHVGAGTFVPVKEADARHHNMHMEHAAVSMDFLERWLNTPEGLIAVGTTSTRSLESLYWLGVKCRTGSMQGPDLMVMGQWDYERLPQDVPLTQSIQSLLEFSHRHRLDQLRFSTRMMIVPGYRFRTISGLLTNFHMPGSTLLLLIAAWIGDDWRKVYDYALNNGFRFLSYGDSSLLLPRL